MEALSILPLGFSCNLLFEREMVVPLDQLVRYWRGKEDTNGLEVIKCMRSLEENMQTRRGLEREHREKGHHKYHLDKRASERTF